jgi:hypothetical protein
MRRGLILVVLMLIARPSEAIQESFTFVGSFTYFDHSDDPTVEPLTGRGTLTCEVFQSPSVDGLVWELSRLSYDFDPLASTPEPTTLLLFGTTAAGPSVARRLKRRRTA